MKTLAKKTIGLLLKTASDILPFSFQKKTNPGCNAIKGNYVRPINYDSLPLPIQQKMDEGYDIEEKKVFALSNVLVSPGGIVFKNLKVFMPSVMNAHVKSLLNHTFLLRQFVSTSSLISFTKPVILVHDQWSQNYYHWLVDLLPRLLLLTDDEKKHTLLLPQYGTDYALTTVSAMGLHNLYDLKTDTFIKAPRLLYPERTAIGTYQNPELLTKVQQRLIEYLKPTPVKPFRKVYASRAKSTKRRILNEQVIFPILEQYGFECVFFEDLTFLQQVNLMWQTSVLIGVHGANLTNILFMQKGATVIELMNHEYLNLVYYRMASALGLPYFFIPGTAANGSDYGDEYFSMKNDLDIEVSPDVLKKILERIFL